MVSRVPHERPARPGGLTEEVLLISRSVQPHDLLAGCELIEHLWRRLLNCRKVMGVRIVLDGGEFLLRKVRQNKRHPVVGRDRGQPSSWPLAHLEPDLEA